VFSFLEELGKVFEDALDRLDVGGLAVNRNVLTAGVNSYV
jgi:predicted O-methyltransferase YrrM